MFESIKKQLFENKPIRNRPQIINLKTRLTVFYSPRFTFFNSCFNGLYFFLKSWLKWPWKIYASSHGFVLNNLSGLIVISMRMIKVLLLVQFSFADSVLHKNAVVDETILHRVGLGEIKGLSSDFWVLLKSFQRKQKFSYRLRWRD